MFKILDKRNGEVTAEQQAVFNKISTNNADGYVDGFLNSLRIAKISSNVISIDSGLLSIQGFRSVNDTLTTYTVSVTPSEPIPFQLVATYSHYISDENDTLEITTRPTQELRREPLFSGQNAVYEVELAEFNMTADGITDFAVTLEKIVYNEQDLSELLDKVTKAEQDSATALEKVNELETQVIEKQGTAVYVGGEAQSRVNFTSDPQTQITANKNAIAEAQSNINNIIDGSQTVGKATRDANGNVIDTTYAKLSQVVRVDAAQSLTIEEKMIAKSNVAITTSKEHSTSLLTGWYRVAKLENRSLYSVTIGQNYNHNTPGNVKLCLNIGYVSAIITQESGIFPVDYNIDRVRVCIGTADRTVFLDVHSPNTYFNDTVVNIDTLYSDFPQSMEPYEDWEYLGESDTVSGYTTTLLNFASGINTTGTIYQQGAPVFATDPTKLAPSTANGWTQTTATGTLPSAGVYMVAPNASIGTLGIGVMFFAWGRPSAAAIGDFSGGSSLWYAPSGDTKWALYGANGTQIQLTDIRYKRIA